MALSRSHSQLGQDIRVARLFGPSSSLQKRYFVEAGANDGIKLSNTYALERDLGWRGVCVEPVQCEFEKLIINRPLAFCSQRPLSSRSGDIVSFNVASQSLLSGIAADVDCHLHSLTNGRRVDMTTETLPDLLERAGAPNVIDYLSLDTEGSEFAILQGLQGSKFIFKLIHVEHNFIKPQRSNIRKLLEEMNYRFVEQNKWDDEYEYCGDLP